MKVAITKLELKEMLASKIPVCVFDVRNSEEYHALHLPFAGNLPIQIIEKNLFTPEPYKTIVTVCGKGGGRSERAALLLRENQQAQAFFLEGGTFEWMKMDF